VTKGRMEAFSDGVIAILITIMVLELGVPRGTDLHALTPFAPVLLTYILSFVSLAIYWNNHHHLLQAAQHVDGRILWANMHLLFWLSLLPVATAWMGENSFPPIPTAAYGFILLMSGVAYFFLVRALIAHGDEHVAIAEAVGRDAKGKISLVIYAIGILLALVAPLAAFAVYIVVALFWFVPDRRIASRLVD
jgi:uncharacterized membrane protein